MKIDLLYGRGKLTVDLPDHLQVTTVRKRAMAAATDPAGDLMKAFQAPTAAAPLRELARTRKTACILVCDITRPVPHGLLLPPLVAELVAGGIPKENILILVATGLHRPNEGEELREVIGSDAVFKSVRIENHFGRDRQATRTSGERPPGSRC